VLQDNISTSVVSKSGESEMLAIDIRLLEEE
jgi:hypothetical protein